jgi:hypothetical protein
MKNIHLLPTEKPSRLQINRHNTLFLSMEAKSYSDCTNQNLYITNSEEIKEGDWVKLFVKHIDKEWVHKVTKEDLLLYTDFNNEGSKIILTTDQDLIADGVQSIDDKFLEWFVDNNSCESVEVADIWKEGNPSTHYSYQLIIPQEEEYKHPLVFSENGNQLFFDNQGKLIKEETKHIPYTGKVWEPPVSETLEEASKRAVNSGLFKDETLFIAGVKWQQERMYSEEEVEKIVRDAYTFGEKEFKHFGAFKEWFEQFKKK